MQKQTDIDDFFDENDFAITTQDRYRRVLLWFLRENEEIIEMRPVQLKKWLQRDSWGDSMRWVAFSAIRSYLRWKYGENHPALKLKISRKEPAPQRTMEEYEVDQLLAWLDNEQDTTIAIRDRAMARLMLDTGLRSTEICRLDVEKIDIRRRRLSVIVKGGEWGEGVFSAQTALELRAWLEARKEIAEKGEKALFVGVGGLTPGRRMTRHGLQCIVRRWGQRAGIGNLSPHDFRRTFATLSTRRGAPERIAMKAGRWKNPIVFSRYVSALHTDDFEPYFPTKQLSGKHQQGY